MKQVLILLNKLLNYDNRVLQEMKILQNSGYKIRVLCKTPEYSNIPYYGKYIQKTICWYLQESKFVRYLSKFSRLLSVPFFNIQLYQKGKRLCKDYNIDIIHANDFDTLLAAILLKLKFQKLKIIYDAHEIYSKMVSNEIPKLGCKLIQFLENLFLKYINSMIVISEPYYHYYKDKVNKNAKIFIFRNCKKLRWKNFYPTKNKQFTLLYIGNNLSAKRYFPKIIDITATIPRIKLQLGGIYNINYQKTINYVKNKKYTHVEFLGEFKTQDAIITATRKADATFILCDSSRTEQYRYNLFNKQFEAMVAGRPIIISDNTYAATITRKFICGICPPHYPCYIKAAIMLLEQSKPLRKKLGRNALYAAKTQFNEENEKLSLLNAYKHI